MSKGKAEQPSAPALPQEPRDDHPLSETDSWTTFSSADERSGSEASTRDNMHSNEQDFKLAAFRGELDEGDAALYKDLLRKAHGNEMVAKSWMKEICGHDGGTCSDTLIAARYSSFSKSDLDTAAMEAGAPEGFFCPISLKLFRDPVMLPTGQTYERRYIERWLMGGRNLCPSTGTVLTLPVTLVPNVALRKSIEVWAEKHARWMLGQDGKVKPIPDDEDFARPGTAGQEAADLTLAVHMQQEELLAGHPYSPASSSPHRDRRLRVCSLLTALLYVITAAQVALYVVALWQNNWLVEQLSQNPLVGPSESRLHTLGALATSDLIDLRQYWRLASSIFLCSGAIQLALTVIALWTFGLHIARALRFPALGVAVIYLISGLVGSLASANLSTHYTAVGAPAAVCGLIGASLVHLGIGHRSYKHHKVSAALMLIMLTLFEVAALLPLSANLFAVLAALVAGALCVCLMAPKEQPRFPWLAIGLQAWCGLALAGLVSMGILGLVFGASLGRSCSWCQSVACVETRWWTCQSTQEPICSYAAFGNGTAHIDCSGGGSYGIYTSSAAAPVGMDLVSICRHTCLQAQAAVPSQAPAPPPPAILI
ncbi:g1307 [Coccomyxa viridis]|uniref:RHOMBOID-like protein n=1 Tax=Coccomyxa viridis TaxID=1274662 RepID=A0ABP1FN54_9CHLO